MDLVSVVVPIYKVEKYLPACLESIVGQTYSNLQIILVDDGSPDSCGQICEEWKQSDSRIEVIHKKNGGLSDARNRGVAVAKGKYLCFVDSDDLLDCHYVEWMHDAASQYKVTLVACNISSFYDGDNVAKDIDVLAQMKEYSSEQALADIVYGKGVRAIACNKLYDLKLIKDEQFRIGKYHEDEFYTYRIVDKAKRIVYLENTLYYYRQRAGSIMKSFSPKHIDALEAYAERIELFRCKYPELYTIDKKSFCVSCVAYYRLAKESNSQDLIEIKRRISIYRKKIRFSVSELRQCGMREVAYIIGSRYCIGAFCGLLNLARGKCNE